jgi:8-oxo-dGTP diphosphatase
LLLLRRKKPPNRDLYSPIGGKLEQETGESPHACALREIEEEISVRLTLDDIRLMGIVSERAFTGTARPGEVPAKDSGQEPATSTGTGAAAHWLMFCFEVIPALDFPARTIDEGRLEWIDPSTMPGLAIPRTDREVIWPLVQRHSLRLQPQPGAPSGQGFFSVHIDCADETHFVVTHEHPRPAPQK